METAFKRVFVVFFEFHAAPFVFLASRIRRFRKTVNFPFWYFLKLPAGPYGCVWRSEATNHSTTLCQLAKTISDDIWSSAFLKNLTQ